MLLRNELDRNFDAALASLEMHFQPIVNADSKNVLAYESLMRPSHSEFNSPIALLNAAERLHRLDELGAKVRGLVAEKMETSDATFFVNLHPMELWDEGLFEENCPLRAFASRVVLEVTEQAPLGSDEALLDRIAALRTFGYRVAVDDFGSGFARVSSLLVLKPELVKLDRGLIQSCQDSAHQRAVITSILMYCKKNNACMIAEGVETSEEFETLRTLGVSCFQGYYFAKPTAELQVINWA